MNLRSLITQVMATLVATTLVACSDPVAKPAANATTGGNDASDGANAPGTSETDVSANDSGRVADAALDSGGLETSSSTDAEGEADTVTVDVSEDVVTPTDTATVDAGDVDDLADTDGQADTATDGGDTAASDQDGSSADSTGLDAPLTNDTYQDAAAVDAGPPTPPLLTLNELSKCDAGDFAWVVRATQGLLGRKPRGVAEATALTQLVTLSSRATVADALMSDERFTQRWRDWLLDELEVNRIGIKGHKRCFATPLLSNHSGALAKHVRDQPPATKPWPKPWNMADLILSALALDDLTAVFRAHLFTMLIRPQTVCDNLTKNEHAQFFREHFGRVFRRAWLHRDVACIGCHNSKTAVNDAKDPAKDRHWPLAGHIEKALFGSHFGAPEAKLDAPWRHFGVVKGEICQPTGPCSKLPGKSLQPWNISKLCGEYAAPNEVGQDPLGTEAHWIAALGKNATVWQVQQHLAQGVAKLRAAGKMKVAADGSVSGVEAFAHQLAARLSHQAWLELVGSRLTMAHGFSRNKAQRDIHASLIATLISSKFSLRALLRAIVVHPLFNQRAPVEGCVQGSAYPLPAVHDPMSADAPLAAQRGNSSADGTRRASSRVVVRMLEDAMQWPAHEAFPAKPDSGPLKGVGVYLADELPMRRAVDFTGALAWEKWYGACKAPNPPSQQQLGNYFSATANSCKQRCNVDDDQSTGGASCKCDASCVETMMCCPDYNQQCAAFNAAATPPQQADWLDAVFSLALDKKAPLRDVVVAMKDRLLVMPDFVGSEAADLTTFFGVSSLDVKWSAVKNAKSKARILCGTLTKTPQFSLFGQPHAPQKSAPALVLPKQTFTAHCTAWAKRVLPPSDWIVTCAPGKITAKKKQP